MADGVETAWIIHICSVWDNGFSRCCKRWLERTKFIWNLFINQLSKILDIPAAIQSQLLSTVET